MQKNHLLLNIRYYILPVWSNVLFPLKFQFLIMLSSIQHPASGSHPPVYLLHPKISQYFIDGREMAAAEKAFIG